MSNHGQGADGGWHPPLSRPNAAIEADADVPAVSLPLQTEATPPAVAMPDPSSGSSLTRPTSQAPAPSTPRTAPTPVQPLPPSPAQLAALHPSSGSNLVWVVAVLVILAVSALALILVRATFDATSGAPEAQVGAPLPQTAATPPATAGIANIVAPRVSSLGELPTPLPFDREVPVSFTRPNTPLASWGVSISRPRDITDELLAANPSMRPPPNGVRLVSFEVEMRLVGAAAQEVAPGQLTWELFGGSTDSIFRTGTVPFTSCQPANEFQELTQVTRGASISGQVCIPVAAQDVADPATRVSMLQDGNRYLFSEDGLAPPRVQLAEIALDSGQPEIDSEWGPEFRDGARTVNFAVTLNITDGGPETMGFADSYSGKRGLRHGDTDIYDIPPGIFIIEQQKVSGWPNPNVTCIGTEPLVDGWTVTIDTEPGDKVSCVFTNVRDEDSLSVLATEYGCFARFTGDLRGAEGPFLVSYRIATPTVEGIFSLFELGTVRVEEPGLFSTPLDLFNRDDLRGDDILWLDVVDAVGSRISSVDVSDVTLIEIC